MTRDEWIAAFAAEVGTQPPTAQEIKELLELAALAAHASERTAAPLACWIAGRSEAPLPELLQAAERVGAASPPPSDAAGP